MCSKLFFCFCYNADTKLREKESNRTSTKNIKKHLKVMGIV